MDKITYLAELAEGLARWVPERERQDILRYYAEYFEEAGPGREGEVISELGDPWALSSRLAVEGGYVTQEAANSWTPRQKKRKVWPFVAAGCAIFLVVAMVPVAILTSLTGNWFGFSANRASNGEIDQVTVVEGTDYAYEQIPNEPGVAYIEDENMTSGFWTMEDGCLDAFTSIDADISLGDITVTEADDFTLFIQQSNSLGGYSVKWEVKDGVLVIRDGGGSGHHVGLDGLGDLIDGDAVTVGITVPDGAELDKIGVKTDMGCVYVASVAAGKITAESDMGDIECYSEHKVKKLDLKTDMGDVVLGIEELESGADIDLETSMGQVEANLGCYERDCAYEIRTDMGNVSVNGMSRGSKAEQKGNMPYKLDIEDDMGDVNVYFQDDRW